MFVKMRVRLEETNLMKIKAMAFFWGWKFSSEANLRKIFFSRVIVNFLFIFYCGINHSLGYHEKYSPNLVALDRVRGCTFIRQPGIQA
jgi:hypothetical protein